MKIDLMSTEQALVFLGSAPGSTAALRRNALRCNVAPAMFNRKCFWRLADLERIRASMQGRGRPKAS